jgi:hypothetical protein
MNSGQFFLFALVIAVTALSGIMEIIPRKLKMSATRGESTEVVHYHGNRPMGAMYLLVAVFGAIRVATELQWIHIPGVSQ